MVLLLRNLADVCVGDCLPFSTNVNLAADLSRIKYYRNTIAHLDKVITDIEFNVMWEDIYMVGLVLIHNETIN